MFQRRRASILLGVVIFASLVLVTVDFRGGQDGPLDRVRGVTTSVLRPVQEGVSTLTAPFTDLGERIGELFRLRSENAELRDRVATLEDRSATRADLERENRELRELLELTDRTELDTVAGRVVALAPSSFEWTVTIDVGTADGIDRGMPVIDGDGLVGRIIQASPNASRVLLAIDPNFAGAARTDRTGEVGTIEGRGSDPMLLQLLDPEGDVEVGDEVVTSSYDDGVFPAGIPVGEVREVTDGPGRLSREAQVSPFVNFSQLHHVAVVRTDGVQPLPPFEGTEGIPFDAPESDEEDGEEDGEGDGDDEGADDGDDDGEGDGDDDDEGDG